MKNKFIAVLSLALATSIFTIGYSEATPVVSNKPVKETTIPVSSEQKPVVTKKILTNKPIPISTSESSVKSEAPQPITDSKDATQVSVSQPIPTASKGLQINIKQPTPTKYMEAPVPSAFQPVVNKDYHLSVPTAFGKDPLANLPGAQGAMILRVQDNLVFMAVNVIDPNDDSSFNPTQALPKFPEKKIRLNWLQGTQGKLECKGSKYDSVNGMAYIIEGKYISNDKTYELLYSFPKEQLSTYLPLVMYSLNSFQMN